MNRVYKMYYSWRRRWSVAGHGEVHDSWTEYELGHRILSSLRIGSTLMMTYLVQICACVLVLIRDWTVMWTVTVVCSRSCTHARVCVRAHLRTVCICCVLWRHYVNRFSLAPVSGMTWCQWHDMVAYWCLWMVLFVLLCFFFFTETAGFEAVFLPSFHWKRCFAIRVLFSLFWGLKHVTTDCEIPEAKISNGDCSNCCSPIKYSSQFISSTVWMFVAGWRLL